VTSNTPRALFNTAPSTCTTTCHNAAAPPLLHTRNSKVVKQPQELASLHVQRGIPLRPPNSHAKVPRHALHVPLALLQAIPRS